MLLGPVHPLKKEGGNRGGGGDSRVWGFCVSRVQLCLCGKDNCPRASLNRPTSMSGTANSTQPVAMTDMTKEGRGAANAKHSVDVGAHESP